MADKAVHKFSIIKHYLSPNSAVTEEGHTVKRENKIWMQDPDGFGRFVECLPYTMHFIYKDPEFERGTIGKCATMCSCGSMAVITGYDVYKHQMSPAMKSTNPGEVLVCYLHALTGVHADGSSE